MMNIEGKTLVACGAYGRRAKLADWTAGKDFKILDGPYFSIRDVDRLKKDGYSSVQLVAASGTVAIIDLNLSESTK